MSITLSVSTSYVTCTNWLDNAREPQLTIGCCKKQGNYVQLMASKAIWIIYNNGFVSTAGLLLLGAVNWGLRVIIIN